MRFGWTATLYGDAGEEEERLAFLDKVVETGCTFWDTAEVCMYGDLDGAVSREGGDTY